MQTLLTSIQWISDRLKILGAACLAGMTFLTCADVVGRYLGHPIFGSVEIVGFMAILSVGLALPYTHQEKGHIGVEIITQMLSKRTQIIIDICTGSTAFLVFAIVTWRMLLYAGTIKKSGEVSMSLEFPEYLIIYALSFCFLVFSATLGREILQNFQRLKKV
jgi:TRAP-type C4-dicarboxylate transport system permease small subunit